jgi:hydroxymethylbilane synthase
MTEMLRIATRGSPLALLQAERVAQILSAGMGLTDDGPSAGSSGDGRHFGGCELVVVGTRGDSETAKPISAIGGEGVFVKEIQQAVLDGLADIAVHSAKDLPSTTPDGLVLACVPERADPRDAIVGRHRLGSRHVGSRHVGVTSTENWLEELPPGATIATGSPRRRAQLAWLRPDLTFAELRGNIATRIARAEIVGAGLIAMAALERLGLTRHATCVLEPRHMLPQVGQGALAVECRSGDAEVLELLGKADDDLAHRALVAERSWLAELGGGCNTPVAAYAVAAPGNPGSLELEGMIASNDGRIVLRSSAVGADPIELGRGLARDMLAHSGATALEEWAT